MQSVRVRRKKIVAYGLIVLGIILGLASGLIFYATTQSEPKPPPGALVSRSEPSSVKPTTQSIAQYTVPAAHPKYIAIPAIGVATTPVLALGLTKDGAIAVPNSIFEAGWYDGSSEPGQPGAMFIYGHVSSWTADGIFYNLKQLKAGDTVVITRGDNTVYTYQVVSIKIYPSDSVDMNHVLAPIQAGTPGLNLMTCTGHVIKGTSEFNERLVVFTKLIAA